MLRPIPRCRPRVMPNPERATATLPARGEIVQGAHLRRVERAFADDVGTAHAVNGSYGRIALDAVRSA
jgi:dTDP-4-amino-4,6-dideoxygalactose transaminase